MNTLNIEIKQHKFQVYSAKNLLTYCEGFILQNLVALLTYDDSVKRLIFGKKLQNHDVITGGFRTVGLWHCDTDLTLCLGLLRTLQERAKRKGPNKSKKHSLWEREREAIGDKLLEDKIQTKTGGRKW